MVPQFTASTAKHGWSRQEASYAIVYHSYSDELVEEVPRHGGTHIALYIGPPHAQSRRELEVLVEHFDDGREAIVFHVMELGSKFRRYREENP